MEIGGGGSGSFVVVDNADTYIASNIDGGHGGDGGGGSVGGGGTRGGGEASELHDNYKETGHPTSRSGKGGDGGNGGNQGGEGSLYVLSSVTFTASPARAAAQPAALSAEDAPAAPVTVTFMSDGTSVGTAQATLMLAPPSAPASAAKANYAFQGYYTAGGTQIYDADLNPVYPVWQTIEDTTLYSQWLRLSNISFVSEGVSVGTATAQKGMALPAATEVTREDYVFLGYFTEATGGTMVYDENRNPVSSVWNSTEDVTCYAHWLPTYTFTFVSEGGTVGSAIYTENGTAKAPVAQRLGDYVFLGYFTESGVQVFDGSGTLVPGVLSGLTPKATLRAQWQRPAGSVARLVYRGQLTKLGKDEPAVSEDKYEKKMHFRVYDGESAETPLWEAKDQPVTVNKDGSFVAAFGDDTLAELIATGSVTHVGVAIGDSRIELTPRRALRPVAAVNRALVAEAASKDIRIGNLLTENALAANNVSVSQLEVYGAVTAPGAGPVEVSPVVVGDKETLTLLRGDGVKVFSNGRTDLGEVANVLRGQKLKEAPADGIALVSSSKLGSRGLRIPGVIQYCRKGDWVRAPASEPDGVKVMFFPFVGNDR